MRRLGLTGTIASGKSTVAQLLGDRGAEVIDCDALAHTVTAAGTPGLAAVRRRFGVGVLTPDGALDRRALGRIVFADAAAMADLEAIVHPLVTHALEARLAASTCAAAVIEAIKLFEAGYAASCDEVWVVVAPPAERVARLVRDRGLAPDEARQRVRAQVSDDALAARADVVLHNDGDRDSLERQVAAAWGRVVDPDGSPR